MVYGGFDAPLHGIHHDSRKTGGQLGMGILVSAMDIATANNTVAIVMANPIAKEMAQTYEITPKKNSIVAGDIFLHNTGILPYGAQMLVAISAVTELGKSISAFDIIPYMFYPFFLLISSFNLDWCKKDRRIFMKYNIDLNDNDYIEFNYSYLKHSKDWEVFSFSYKNFFSYCNVCFCFGTTDYQDRKRSCHIGSSQLQFYQLFCGGLSCLF